VENPDFIDITLSCLRFGHGGHRGRTVAAFRSNQHVTATTQADRQEAAMLYIDRRQQKHHRPTTAADTQEHSQRSRLVRSSSSLGTRADGCAKGSSGSPANRSGTSNSVANASGSGPSQQEATPGGGAAQKRKTEAKPRRQPIPRTLWVRPTKLKAITRTTRTSRADRHEGQQPSAAAVAEAASALTNRELEAASPLATSR
jgi:hypothetical protein